LILTPNNHIEMDIGSSWECPGADDDFGFQ
jgi:hypothetical protein